MTGFVRAIELRNEPHVDAVMVEDMVADVEPHDGVPSWLWGVCGFADVALGVAGLEVIGSFGVDLKGGRGYVLRGHRGSWCVWYAACVTIEMVVVDDPSKVEV
jgi:hypothetical protein